MFTEQKLLQQLKTKLANAAAPQNTVIFMSVLVLVRGGKWIGTGSG